MLVKGIEYEDFVNYRVACMYIAMPRCTFKCDTECGRQVCQNSELANAPDIEVNINEVINRYRGDSLTRAIVFGGLEPIDSFEDVYEFIHTLRQAFFCKDMVVIYTGYNEDEIPEQISRLQEFPNIIVKFGRFIPDDIPYWNELLGVKLASSNQYARLISNEDTD